MDDAEDQQIAPGKMAVKLGGMNQRQKHYRTDDNLNKSDMLRR